MNQNEGGHIDIVCFGYLIEHCLIRLKRVLPYYAFTYIDEVAFRSWRTYDENLNMFCAIFGCNELDLLVLPYMDSMRVVVWDARKVMTDTFIAQVNSISTLQFSDLDEL